MGAIRPCLTCGRPSPDAYCPRHTTDKGYSTPHWQKLRAQVLQRDRYRCQLKHDGCTGRATTVHLDPSLGGLHRNALAKDCLSACLHCHGVEDARRAKHDDAASA